MALGAGGVDLGLDLCLGHRRKLKCFNLIERGRKFVDSLLAQCLPKNLLQCAIIQKPCGANLAGKFVWKLHGQLVMSAILAASRLDNHEGALGVIGKFLNSISTGENCPFDIARGCVADMQPYHLGWSAEQKAQLPEIVVFGNKHETVLACVFP